MSAWGDSWGDAWGDSWGAGTPPTPTVTIDTHDGNRDYKKRRKQQAELHAMISGAMNPPTVSPVMAKAVGPMNLTAFDEDDDEEVLLVVMH